MRPEIKAYDKVITKQAKSDAGLFTVHRIKDKHLLRDPGSRSSARNSSGSARSPAPLWVSVMAARPPGIAWSGGNAGRSHPAAQRRIRHHRRSEDCRSRAPCRPRTTRASSMVFNIETMGKDDAPVIDVTRLFTTETPEFSCGPASAPATSTPPARSSSASFHSPRTSRSKRPTPSPRRPNRRRAVSRRPRSPNAMREGSASVLMHYSMVKLPEQPMTPRLFDERRRLLHRCPQLDYGVDEHRAPEPPLHHALAAREEEPVGCALRSGEADRLLG